MKSQTVAESELNVGFPHIPNRDGDNESVVAVRDGSKFDGLIGPNKVQLEKCRYTNVTFGFCGLGDRRPD